MKVGNVATLRCKIVSIVGNTRRLVLLVLVFGIGLANGNCSASEVMKCCSPPDKDNKCIDPEGRRVPITSGSFSITDCAPSSSPTPNSKHDNGEKDGKSAKPEKEAKEP